MNESPWTRDLEEYLGNVLMLPYIGTEFSMNWPDRFVSSIPWSGWIEFKNPKTVLRDAQWANVRRLQQFGTMACVVRRTQTRRDFSHEIVQIHITHKKLPDAKTAVKHLLQTLARMFAEIRATTHNYLAMPGFFGEHG